MKKYNKNGNGAAKVPGDLQSNEIEFPVTYQLKAVLIGTENDDDNKEKLVSVFEQNEIPYQYHDKRVSSKGAYVSFTYIVTIQDKPQMSKLYEDLKAIKELKFAV